jgi:hypothetical protein
MAGCVDVMEPVKVLPPPQPDMPVPTASSSKTNAPAPGRLRNVHGNSKRKAAPAAVKPCTRLLVCAASVAIETVKFVVLAPESARLGGAKEQLAFAGSPLQLNVMVPEYPLTGVSERL